MTRKCERLSRHRIALPQPHQQSFPPHSQQLATYAVHNTVQTIKSTMATGHGIKPSCVLLVTLGAVAALFTVPAAEATAFGNAFAKAHAELGPGRTFEFNGKLYSTNHAKPAVPKAPMVSQHVGMGHMGHGHSSFAHSNSGPSFKTAFADARAAHGPGATFNWHGKSYSTNKADDPPSPQRPSAPSVAPRTAAAPSVPHKAYTGENTFTKLLWNAENDKKLGVQGDKYMPYARSTGQPGAEIGPGIEISQDRSDEIRAKGGLTHAEMNSLINSKVEGFRRTAANKVNEKAGNNKAWDQLNPGQQIIVTDMFYNGASKCPKLLAEAAKGSAANTDVMLREARRKATIVTKSGEKKTVPLTRRHEQLSRAVAEANKHIRQ